MIGVPFITEAAEIIILSVFASATAKGLIDTVRSLMNERTLARNSLITQTPLIATSELKDLRALSNELRIIDERLTQIIIAKEQGNSQISSSENALGRDL